MAISESTGRREARREQLRELSRGQLLDAAEEVFGECGMHEATIKEIADRAEYSVGSVYTFFESKSDLFVAVFERRGVEMRAGIATCVGLDAPAIDRVAALAVYEVEFFRRYPAYARMYLRSSAIGTLLPDTPMGNAVDLSLDESLTSTVALFREGQENGTVCAGDPWTLTRLLSGLVSGYQAVDAADPTRADSFPLEAFAALVRRTFLAQPPSK